MIKLIACDIDGTLLRYGEKQLHPEVFEQIDRLRDAGVIFCPASGRSFGSLIKLFSPVADKIYFISGNGSLVCKPYTGSGGASEHLISKSALPREKVLELCSFLLGEDSFELLANGADVDYICPKKLDLTEPLRKYGYNIKAVGSPEDIAGDILKVTAYCTDGSEKHIERMKRLWGKGYNVDISGPEWIDITVADKGTGVSNLSRLLSIPLSEVMAIGDNYNDLPMLGIVGHPVVMSGANEDIKCLFSTHCSNVADLLSQIAAD